MSSGAAVTEQESLYGKMKKEEESKALSLVTDEKAAVILRAYSVTGGHVRRPLDYAFSNFVLKASTGHIEVTAESLVRRRYCAVSDALTVCLRAVSSGASGVMETGGPLVEMGELADRVASVVNPNAVVSRAKLDASQSHDYHSDDSSWQSWTQEFGVQTLDLDDQIRQVAKIIHKQH